MKTLSRSAAVGILASAADLVVLVLLVHGCGLGPRTANLPALLVGVFIQYFGNKYWAFEDRSTDHLRQGSAFALVELGTLALNAGGFHLLVAFRVLPYPLIRVLVSLSVYLGFSYPLWRRVFRVADAGAKAEDRESAGSNAAPGAGRVRC